MPRRAEARAWWADVEDVRERIEHRRATERIDSLTASPQGSGRGRTREDSFIPRRTVSISGRARPVVGAARLRLVEQDSRAVTAASPGLARRRPRRRPMERMGTRPDRVAGLAVLLGFVLVVAAVLSAHG
jgi:hypothetical protein